MIKSRFNLNAQPFRFNIFQRLKPGQPGFGQKEKAQELQYKKQKGSLVSGAVTVKRVCVW